MADLHERVGSTEWIYFVAKPIVANFNIVREFYANATKTDFANDLVVTVREKQVRFDPRLINEY